MPLRQRAVHLIERLGCSARSSAIPLSNFFSRKSKYSVLTAGEIRFSNQHDFQGQTWSNSYKNGLGWIFLSGQAVFILATNSTPSLAEDISSQSSSESDTSTTEITGLQKVDDGSVISNVHTSKWRVFTDSGRDYFVQGKLEEAERFFLSALQEAKEGFGERDPHVASSCNNLAELYRVRKAFDKAEPLYVMAINILEEYFGPDDIRVGAALHNLGQFYLGQKKLEQARVCYERALKIKRRVLGEAHREYADTIYHLGMVLYLQGREKDAEDLIWDSIQILEASGLGESNICIRRLQYLAQIYLKASQLTEAENLMRRILHITELSKGWSSMETVLAAQRLASTLQLMGRLREAEEHLTRCLGARKILLGEDHIQNAANMLFIARVKMLNCNQLEKTDISQAMIELDMAKELLSNSIRIAQQALVPFVKQRENNEVAGLSKKSAKDGQSALLILLQSLSSLGVLSYTKLEKLQSEDEHLLVEAEAAVHQYISAFKEYETLFYSPEVRAEYLSSLRLFFDLVSNSKAIPKGIVAELRAAIQHAEQINGNLNRAQVS